MTKNARPTKPPELHDVDFERDVIGSLMTDIGAMWDEEHIAKLRPVDFWDESLRNVWSAIYRLHTSQKNVLPAFVARELECHSWLGEGGVPTSEELTQWIPDSVLPSVVNTKAARLRELYRRRRLVGAAEDLAKSVYNHNGTLSGDVEAHIAALQEIENEQQTTIGWAPQHLSAAFEEREPLTYIVGGLLATGTLTVVYGQPGGLKTMLVQDLALSVASGKPWLEPVPGQVGRQFPTEIVPVLWVDYDNGGRRTADRLEALTRGHGIDPETTPFYYVTLPHPWLDASNSSHIDGLINLVIDGNIGLVVIDNLGLVSGGVDENSAEMIQVMSGFRQVAEAGAAVVVIAHERKGTGFNGKGSEGLRGHSSIAASLDLALLVERAAADSSEVACRATKTRDLVVPQFAATWTYEHKTGTYDLQSGRFYSIPCEDAGSQAAIEAAILDTVGYVGEIGKDNLIATVKESLPEVGVGKLRGIIDGLAGRGVLNCEKGGKTGRSKLYSMANPTMRQQSDNGPVD